MARSNPDKNPLPVSIERERENAIQLLTDHFAKDNLSLEELESRIERVYQAGSPQAVRDLTRDLPTEAQPLPAERRPAPLPAAFAPKEGRILSFAATTIRRGWYQVPPELKIVSIMAETQIDLTEAEFGPGVTEIRLRTLMTSVTLVLPPHVRVVSQPGSFMSDVEDESGDVAPPRGGPNTPVVRITGTVVMSQLKVAVRQRERPLRNPNRDDVDFQEF